MMIRKLLLTGAIAFGALSIAPVAAFASTAGPHVNPGGPMQAPHQNNWQPLPCNQYKPPCTPWYNTESWTTDPGKHAKPCKHVSHHVSHFGGLRFFSPVD